ncbi:MAG TPA: MDR family MFS transporter [Ktedonobacteraceae bacterium]|nr:MDR family MFS transporter [Ktedonobacteraceae bacterium]
MNYPKINPKVSVSIVFVAATFVSIMDSTIVNVALPSLGKQLGVTGSSIDAVVVAYMVSLAVVIPVSGWLGDRLGTKRIFLLALALFCLSSALCGLAATFPMLILFRVLQGLSGGALIPVGTAILYRTFPPVQRVQISRILILPTVIAPAVGPVLGGFIVDQLSWRWVFYVNVPIGIVVFFFGLLYLSEHREPGTGRFDLLGFALAGTGLAGLMYALSEGSSAGWTSPPILLSGLGGLLILTAFAFIELRTPKPMIDLRLFSDRAFRITNLISLFATAGFLGTLFIAPLYLQEARGVSALVSGLTTFPEAIGVVISTQLVAWLYPRVGPRRLMAGGLIGVAIMMALMSMMGSDTNLWIMRVLMFLTGAGMAYVFLPIQAVAFATITPAATGRASAIYSAQRQIGAALGVAILGSVLGIVGPIQVSQSGKILPNMTAYHAAFLAASCLSLLAAGIALTIRDRDAANTMQKRGSKRSTDKEHSETQSGAESLA